MPAAGGRVVPAPAGFDGEGLWVTDPHGMLFHLVDLPAEAPLPAAEPFAINAPGRIVRNRRSAILPARDYAPARPLRLGHMLCFSPDVPASVRFVTEGLGMALADQAQDVIAFTCARRNSEHHVLAFAKSPGIGFHHASFQVADPDEVGRGGGLWSIARGVGTGALAATRSDRTSSIIFRTHGGHGSNIMPTWILSTTMRCGRRPIMPWKTVWPVGGQNCPKISCTITKSARPLWPKRSPMPHKGSDVL
jgi:hypothetical protein